MQGKIEKENNIEWLTLHLQFDLIYKTHKSSTKYGL